MKSKVTLLNALKAGAYASIAAAVVNGILFTIFHSLDIITDDVFIQPNMPMSIFPIVFSSVFPTMIASLVFFLIDKFTSNGFKIFRLVSYILLILSFLNPFLAIPGVTTSYAIALNIMHVVVVIFLLYFIKNAINKNN